MLLAAIGPEPCTIVAVVADRARARLLPRLDDPRSCGRSRAAWTRSSRTSARSSRRARRSTTSSATSTRNLDAGVDLLEGLLVKKAGLADAVGLVEGLYPGAAAAGLPRTSPTARTIEAPRIGEVYTEGTLTLARLGREAPIAAASPAGAGAAQRRGRQPRGALLYPDVRQTRAGEAAALAGDRHRRARAVRAARRHRRATQAAPPRAGRERPDRSAPALVRRVTDPAPDREGARCRHLRHSSTSVRRASRARSRRSSGSAPRRASSPAGTACCR